VLRSSRAGCGLNIFQAVCYLDKKAGTRTTDFVKVSVEDEESGEGKLLLLF